MIYVWRVSYRTIWNPPGVQYREPEPKSRQHYVLTNDRTIDSVEDVIRNRFRREDTHLHALDEAVFLGVAISPEDALP